MKLKTFGKNILLVLFFLVIVLSCVKMSTKAEEETGIRYLENTTIADCRKNGIYTAPTAISGYVFGGWYNDDKGQDPMTEEEANQATTAFAKWVPDYVLSIKAQVNQNALDDNFEGDNRAAIRLLTSVDSQKYQAVGFDVVRGDYPTYTYHLNSKNIFTQVRVIDGKDGEYEDKKPEDVFGSESHFFEAVTFINMPVGAVNTELKATPYWVTPDGTRVEGAYSIKTVNLGRSWVYIGSGDTLNNEGEYGTHGHPYSSFSDALESIALKTTGKIYIRNNSTVQVGSDFKWTQRGYDFTILGESGKTETLDFSPIQYLVMGDSVTFSNMTLKYFGNNDASYDGKVFANGNRLKISTDVASDNARTYMFGGGYDSSSVEKTDITVLAGQYLRVYGGSNATASTKKGVVTGDTHVTFGGSAKADYVCGGGAGNSKVQGTCHVEFTGGTASEGIYGGGASSSATNSHTSVIMSGGTVQQIFGGNQAGMTGNVYLEINGGTVTRRVYGGCYNNYLTELEAILSNKTKGWQSNKYVDGRITVVIKDNANLQCDRDTDRGILACSRHETKSENETGILIYNDALYDTYGGKTGSSSFEDTMSPYDYLIKATEGGDVLTKTDVVEGAIALSIQPSAETKAGTVTDTNNSNVTYFKGKGVCELPTFTENQTSSIVEVDFNPSDVQSELDSCESRIDGIYYPALEDAVDFAKVRKDTPFVTLMKDAGVEAILEVASGQTLKIQSGNEQTWSTITGTGASALFNVKSGGKLVVRNLNLTGDGNTLYTQGTLEAQNLYIHDIKGVGVYQEAGTADVKNVEIENATKFGIFITKGQTTADNVTINNVGTDGSNRYAIKCQGSGKLTITANNTAKNGVTITGMAKGGGITNASSDKLEAVGVNIDGVTGTKYYPIYIEAGKEMEITDLNITRASGNTTELINIASDATFTLRGNDETKSINGNASAGDTYVGRGVVVDGTFNMYGGNINNNKLSSGNGAGVQVKAGGVFNMYGGSVSGNTAPNGGGVSLEGTAAVAATDTEEAKEAVPATFNLEGGTVSGNKATTAGGGVYITNSKLTMSETSSGSIYNNTGTTDGAGVYLFTGALFDMYNGNITENKCQTSNARGGGVCIYASDAVFTLYGGSINKNTARAGGAVIVRAGHFIMNGGTLSENQAVNVGNGAGQGGAVYIHNAKFTMNDGNVFDNTAQDQGQAIFANGGTFNWNGGTFTNYTGTDTVTGTGSPVLNIKTSIYEINKGLINSTKIKAINLTN